MEEKPSFMLEEDLIQYFKKTEEDELIPKKCLLNFSIMFMLK